MTWNAEKELHLAFRALRAEVNRIAGELDKVLRWFNKAEQYLDMKRLEDGQAKIANRLSRGDPNDAQYRQEADMAVSRRGKSGNRNLRRRLSD